MVHARETAEHVLSWLNLQGDEAAVYTFDTWLEEVMPFTTGLRRLPSSMDALSPFGARICRVPITPHHVVAAVLGREA